MNYLSSFPKESLTELGMEGFSAVSPSSSRRNRVEQAFELLETYAASSLWLSDLTQIVRREAKQIVWLKADHSEAQPFASAAYPELPGILFLTDAIFCGLPPSLVLSELHDYCVIENLIHESLHHDLEKRIVATSEETGEDIRSTLQKSVWIPWRETHWSQEKALHALYVYSVVRKLREWAVQSLSFKAEDLFALQTSLLDVEKIVRYLTREVPRYSSLVGGSFERVSL